MEKKDVSALEEDKNRSDKWSLNIEVINMTWKDILKEQEVPYREGEYTVTSNKGYMDILKDREGREFIRIRNQDPTFNVRSGPYAGSTNVTAPGRMYAVKDLKRLGLMKPDATASNVSTSSGGSDDLLYNIRNLMELRGINFINSKTNAVLPPRYYGYRGKN